MIKLADISTIISNINLTLRSFFESGQLLEEDIYRHAEYIIKSLDIGLMTNFEIVLTVEDYKTCLPSNFEYLNFIYRCSLENNNTTVKKRYFLGRPITWKEIDYEMCYKNKCTLDPTEKWITRTIHVEGEQTIVDRYEKKEILSQVKRVKSNSPQLYSESENHFAIEGKYAYFNFKEDEIFISYYGYEFDENGYYKVVDHPAYLKAVETYVIYQLLLTMYYNNEADVQQRMLYAEKEYKIAFGHASYLSKLSDYNSFLKKGKLKQNKLDLFNLPSNADYNKHRRVK